MTRHERRFIIAKRRLTRHATRLPVATPHAPVKMNRLELTEPVTPGHRPSDPARVGALIAGARREARLRQVDLGARIGLSERSMSRIESGRIPPSGGQCVELAEALVGASEETWRELVAALELPVARVIDAASAAPAPPPAAGAHARLDEAVRSYAEDLDVSARRLRAVLAAFLSDVERLGLSLPDARAMVASRAKK